MKVYGIKSCGSVKKAIALLKSKDIEYELVDFKKEQVAEEKIDYWLKSVSIDKLFNNRGTKYRTLKLKELNLDENGKREWLIKENMLIKRPVIECDDGEIIVGYDEEYYNSKF
jgi:Spx/MgsR family transcriptional regulator